MEGRTEAYSKEMFIITGKNITQRVAEVWREAEKFRRLRTIRFPPLPSAFSATLRVVFLTKARPPCGGRGGSVSRILSTLAGRDVIPLGPASLLASSNLPAGSIGPILTDCSARRLIWSCSVRGLPCPLCHQRGGGLLPHPFTLACAPFEAIGGLLSVALSVGSLRPGVTRLTALRSPDFPLPLRTATP